MAKWRERKSEGTYFKQISLFRTRCIYVAGRTDAICICTARLDAPRRDLPFFSLRGGEEGFEFKRFKTISQGVARRIVGSQTPIDRQSFFFSFLPFPFLTPQTLLSTRPFSLLLAPFSLFGCDLLRTFNRTTPTALCRKRLGGVPSDAENFVWHEKWCRHARNASRLVSSRHVLPESRRLSCVIITFMTRTGCRKNAGDIADRVAGNPVATSED